MYRQVNTLPLNSQDCSLAKCAYSCLHVNIQVNQHDHGGHTTATTTDVSTLASKQLTSGDDLEEPEEKADGESSEHV